MNDRSEEALARKIYLELLSRENLEVIDGPRTTALVQMALQFAAAFREGARDGLLAAQDPKRGRRAPEAFAVRQEPRRTPNREPTPAGEYVHRHAPLAELKAANESEGRHTTAKSHLKRLQSQPLE